MLHILQYKPYLPTNTTTITVCLGHSVCSQHGQPEASGAAAAEGRFSQGGDHPGQHSQTTQLSEGLQCCHPLADAALCRVG